MYSENIILYNIDTYRVTKSMLKVTGCLDFGFGYRSRATEKGWSDRKAGVINLRIYTTDSVQTIVIQSFLHTCIAKGWG